MPNVQELSIEGASKPEEMQEMRKSSCEKASRKVNKKAGENG